MIYLRGANRNDCRSLATLRAASLVELEVLPARDEHIFVPQALRDFHALFESERIFAWIACDADRVVASSCVVFFDRLPYPEGSLHAELCGVYVMPDYRNEGLASELVRETVAGARAGGARQIFLRPSRAARALYARLGFVETELMTFVQTDRATSVSLPLRGAGVPEPLSGYACAHEYGNHPC